MLYTIIQIIAFQALFLLVYDLFLKRETFFNYNRAYLLVTALVSLVLPFLKFPELKRMAPENFVIQLPEVFIGVKTPTTTDLFIAEQAGLMIEQPETPWWQIIGFLGMAIATLIFLIKMSKLYRLKDQNPKRWSGNILIVNLLQSSAAFSFFNTVFLGERISATERSTIVKHELVHVKDYHTVDLLFFEVLRIVMWFNPLVYIYQHRIKELHEYIADARAVKQNGKSEYYQSLLNQIFDVNNVSFTNTFFKKSLLKKRIAMLQKSKSRPLLLLKYMLLIPLLLGMLIYTSTEVRAQQKSETQTEAAPKRMTDENQINAYYDQIVGLDKEDGETYFKIGELFDYSSQKYIPTKDEYLRYVAYTRFMGKKFKRSAKAKDSTGLKNIQRFERMITFNDSYDDYLEYLKTEKAQELKKMRDSNRTLQVISEDIGNLTVEEHKDAYEKSDDVLNGPLYNKLIIKDDDEKVEITKVDYDALIRFFSKDELKKLLSKTKTQNPIIKKDTTEVAFSEVDLAPTLIKCKDLVANNERKDCLSKFINEHVVRNFNTALGDSLDPGRKRVFVQFKIDTSGNINKIVARGPSELLEDEAIRVIKTLPQFEPGKQDGELVVVPFAMPIVFEVVGKTKTTTSATQTINNRSIPIEKRHNVIPFAMVDLAPAFEGCEQLTDSAELKACTNQLMSSYINQNFNLDVAEKLEVKGRQKVFCSFVINRKGDVEHIKARASYPELEAEAKRVIRQMPTFTPGQNKGEIVDVALSIPIMFQIADPKKY